MGKDIFEFWSEAAPDDKIHPRDKEVLGRIEHGFNLQCLPAGFSGPLKTAPVVLLYLSPGFSQADLDEADTVEGQARYSDRRNGYQSLQGPEKHKSAWKWLLQRTKAFGSWDQVRDKLAILNISPYHSKQLTHKHVLSALPSCRATLDWAQEVLFPQAEQGKRIVVCMRSAGHWGVGKVGRYGKSLYVPAVNRAGHMTRSNGTTATRDHIIKAVASAIANPM